MAKFEVKNSEGKKVAEAELAAEVYGIEPNIHVMHHIVKCQMASWRQGTQSAKGRSEVSGGGKKPWRQKGTGRARQGSIRAAQWRHGGVVFAPKPRSYAKRMNNKEVKLAMRSALSAKLADGELVLVCCPQGVPAEGWRYHNPHQCVWFPIEADWEAPSFKIVGKGICLLYTSPSPRDCS